MTAREARRKLGTRSNRRRNTNGKNIWTAPVGNGGRVTYKYRNPRPVKRTAAIAVARAMRNV